MSEFYPFPIPESIKTEVLKQVGEACRPWATLDNWADSDNDPVIFGYLFSWKYRVKEVLEAVKLLAAEADPELYKHDCDRAKWAALHGSVAALELWLLQLGGLLAWGRLSWPHDPNVRAAFEPETVEEEAETAAESDKVIRLQRPEPTSSAIEGGTS